MPISTNDEYVEEDSIRCPSCLHITTDLTEQGLYNEGCTNITCEQCDHDYEIETTVSFTFTCPPKVTNE